VATKQSSSALVALDCFPRVKPGVAMTGIESVSLPDRGPNTTKGAASLQRPVEPMIRRKPHARGKTIT